MTQKQIVKKLVDILIDLSCANIAERQKNEAVRNQDFKKAADLREQEKLFISKLPLLSEVLQLREQLK
jgi:hypothetical protein